MNKKGITLVALVVTIIILLILATVTIGLIIGDNSLFRRANEGKLKNELTQLGERLQSAGTTIITEVHTGEINDTQKADRNYIWGRLKAIDAVDATEWLDDINDFSKNNTHPIYTFTREHDEDNSLVLIYTLDLKDFKSDYEI